MTRAMGSSAVVKFCEEATWGTTPAAPSTVYGVNIRSESLGSTKNLFQSETINSYRTVVGLGDGNRGASGGLVMDFLPEGLEVLFAHLLGDTAPTHTGSGPYTHVIKGKATYREGIVIEKDFVNISKFFIYNGCRVNSATINLVQEGFHDVNFDFVAKSEYMGDYDPTTPTDPKQMPVSPAATFPTKNGFTGYQCSVFIAAAGAGAYGAALGNVVSGSISITNNVESDGYVLGSGERASAVYQKRECSGDFSVFFEDATMYNYYLNGTEVKMKFFFDNGVGQTLTIEFPRCKLGGEAPKIASASGINLSMNFRARYDTTNSTDVIMTFVNSIATF